MLRFERLLGPGFFFLSHDRGSSSKCGRKIASSSISNIFVL